jgi:RimJ/RimL family protein N-acetyltransferase
MTAPRLETDRLILRGRTMADFPAYAAIWAAPETQRFTTRASVSTEEAWTKFARIEGFWSLTGCGWWLVVEKATDAVIGEVGVADFKREIVPSLDGMPEYGWMLAPSAHGKGFAKEAVGAALRWGDRKFRGVTFCCIIDDENLPSINVATSHGFRRAQTGRYRGSDISIYHRAPL